MALALRFDSLLKDGTAKDYADLARLGNVTRTRMTQIMNLLNLAPDIQETLLFLPEVRTWRDPISERTCRPVVEEPCWGASEKSLQSCSPRPPTKNVWSAAWRQAESWRGWE